MSKPVLSPNTTAQWFWIVRGFVFLFSIAGNGLVVCLLLRRKRLIRIISNWFVLSLAIADLLVTLITLPEAVYVIFFDNIWPWSHKLVYDMFLKASSFNLCAMTLERYIAVVHPLKYSYLICNVRLLYFILAVPWILGFVSPWPYYICLLYENYVAFQVVQVLFLFGCEILPTVVLLLAYIKMVVVVRRQEKTMTQQCKQVQYNYGPTSVQHKQRDKKSRSNIQVIGAIVFIYAVCYSVSFYKGFVNYVLFKKVSKWSVVTARLLYQVNSAVNGFVYTLLKRDIKIEVKNIAVSYQRK